jgi:hypothetical protein
MDTYQAIGIAEGFIECEDQDKVIQAWQSLIDSGLCWQLQGWFGRSAVRLIEEGICTLPDEDINDNKTSKGQDPEFN